MVSYKKLTEEEIEHQERMLIEKADRFWIETYGKEETTDIEKIKLLSRQGKIDSFQHDVMTGYFRKQGFWRDGKTTLQEREKQLTLEKTKFAQKITKIRNSRARDIDQIIEKAKQKKKELMKIPVKLKEEYKIDKDKILQKLRDDLDAFYEYSDKNIRKEITDVYEGFITMVKERQNDMIDKAINEIAILQQEQKGRMTYEVVNYATELEAELQVLDNVENDEVIIKQYEEEIKKINQEINEIRDLHISFQEIEEEIEMFVCPYCEREFKSKGALGSHVRFNHEEKWDDYQKIKEEVSTI